MQAPGPLVNGMGHTGPGRDRQKSQAIGEMLWQRLSRGPSLPQYLQTHLWIGMATRDKELFVT